MNPVSTPRSDIRSTRVDHIPELDGIRAIAALMVMFFHLPMPTADVPWLGPIKAATVFGQSGVDLFFVLSGFLITRILLRAKRSDSYFSRFYIRRSLRIFPLYYFFLVIYYLTYPILIGRQEIGIVDIGAYALYLQNITPLFKFDPLGPNHYWSLAIEEHFYLLWPLVVRHASMQQLSWIIGVCIAGAATLRGFTFPLETVSTYHFTLTRIDALAAGAGLAVFELSRGISNRDFRAAVTLLVISLMGCVVVLAAGGRSGGAFGEIFKFTFLALLYAFFILSALTLNSQNPVRRILRFRLLAKIGAISYGLYVYHQWCYRVVAYLVPDLFWPVFMALQLILPFFVAWASFSLLERPILKLKRYFPQAQ